MPLPSLARVTGPVCGLLGGLAWLLRWPLGGVAEDAAYWVGFVLLAVSLAAYGAGLVKVGWLRVVVGLALPVLVWSVLVFVRGGVDPEVVDALVGLGMVVASLRDLARTRQTVPARPSGRRVAGRAG